MKRFARDAAIGVAVCGTTFVMFKINNMVLNIMSAVNTEVIRTLLSLGQLPPDDVLVKNTPEMGADAVAFTAAAIALSKRK